jgi:hypothetical protein
MPNSFQTGRQTSKSTSSNISSNDAAPTLTPDSSFELMPVIATAVPQSNQPREIASDQDTKTSGWSLKTIVIAVVIGTIVVTAIVVGCVVGRRPVPLTTKSATKSVDYKLRYNDIHSALSLTVDTSTWLDPNSPQSRALDWLVYKDTTVNNNTNNKLTQRYALMVIYYACSGPDWTTTSRPLEQQVTVDECDFDGITCDANREIAQMAWTAQKITGQLPDEIGLLRKLTFLGVSENYLVGTIPKSIYELTDLSKCAGLAVDFLFAYQSVWRPRRC